MITEIERKSYTQKAIPVGEDTIVASMPIPPGGVFRGFRAEIHGIKSTHMLSSKASGAFFKAAIVGTGASAMDASLSLETLWDQMVPKDVDLSVVAGADDIKWDDGAVNTPFEEPGHINWNDMLELGVRPITLHESEQFVTYASTGAKFPHVDTTDEYYPTFIHHIGSNQHVRVRQASYFLLAIGSPSWDEVTTTVPSTIAEHEYSLLTYPDVMFDMMLPDILGITEAGAESPFADAASRIVAFVEPPVFEENTGDFQAAIWQTYTRWKCRVLTPGRPQMKTLTGGMPG